MPSPPEFATTWWGREWLAALEGSARLDPSRLSRGRTYARRGAVGALVAEPGRVRARVTGSHGRYYTTEVGVRTIAPEAWADVADALAARSAHSAALADGELDPQIVDDVRSAGVELLPGPGDLRPNCTCADWAVPCKHAAAVCYLLASELDRDPFVLFLLRGVERDDLVDMLRDRRRGGRAAATAPAAAGVVASEAWAGWTLDGPVVDDEIALPDSLPALPVVPTPSRPGRPPAWDARVPPGDAVDAERVDELAVDATLRAWRMLVDGEPSGLIATPRGDIARRAAESGRGRELQVLSQRTRLPTTELLAWADAWELGGDPGVAVVADPDLWQIDQETLAAGRDRLVAMGIPKRSVALNYDSLGMPNGMRIVLGPDRRWYRLQARHQPRGVAEQYHLVVAPSPEIEDVIDLDAF